MEDSARTKRRKKPTVRLLPTAGNGMIRGKTSSVYMQIAMAKHPLDALGVNSVRSWSSEDDPVLHGRVNGYIRCS
jgi:hypothetical protein